MDDFISKQAVIDTVRKIILEFFSDEDDVMNDTEKTLLSVNKAICNGVRELPSAEPKSANELAEKVQNAPNDDFISRKVAIDALDHMDYMPGEWAVKGLTMCKEIIKGLSSAQPETHEEHTETHACDLISRQVAIDALVGVTMFKTKHELMQRVNASVQDEQGWLGAVAECLDEIEDLPSAQPEPCVDTIDALDESIKHFDDMAEECRRNANIEQNDYMDMRDDAAEYRQLSIWLNELKWLRERFQSQPDLSEYCKRTSSVRVTKTMY